MKRVVVVALLVIASVVAGFGQMRGMRMSAPPRPMARPAMGFAHPRFGGMRPGFAPRPMGFAPRPGFSVRPGFVGRRPVFGARPVNPLRSPFLGRNVTAFPRPNRGRVIGIHPRAFRGNSQHFFRGHHHRPDFDFDDFDGDADDFFFTSPFLFGGFSSPFFSPFYDPFFGDAFFSDYGTSYSNVPSSPSDSEAVNSSITQLSNQVSELGSQMDLLREQNDMLQSELQQRRTARTAPTPSADLAASSSEPPVVLIFRDGHRTEIQNYAIVGRTVWILSDKRATKVPLADLDLDQTTQVNRDRGLNFSIGPSPH